MASRCTRKVSSKELYVTLYFFFIFFSVKMLVITFFENQTDSS